MAGRNGKTCFSLEIPILEYQTALDLQHRLVAARQAGVIENDTVLMLEHPSVFTLGRRGGAENLKVSRSFLDGLKIPVIQVERGGDITFHGPGQLVVYPIVDLARAGLKIIDYVSGLEEIMLRTVSDWGIFAERNCVNRGIWIGDKKLGSVGISVKRGISFHGFALNVSLSLEPFQWIHPCGLADVDVTSMARELSKNICVNPVRESVKYHLSSVFGFKLIEIEHAKIHQLLRNCSDRNTLMTLSRPT
ncbi:MAG: lipoyl(octanoyl) transferase LipB [Desulfobacterales bacterium]